MYIVSHQVSCQHDTPIQLVALALSRVSCRRWSGRRSLGSRVRWRGRGGFCGCGVCRWSGRRGRFRSSWVSRWRRRTIDDISESYICDAGLISHLELLDLLDVVGYTGAVGVELSDRVSLLPLIARRDFDNSPGT